MKSVGTQLREGRERLGWTLKAASKATKIRENQLHKLEDDDFARFHAPAYVRGFVRNYAAALGLNVAELTQQMDTILEVEGEVSYQRSGGINYVPELARAHRQFNPRSLALMAAVLILLGVAAIFGWEIYRVASALQLTDATNEPQGGHARVNPDGKNKSEDDLPRVGTTTAGGHSPSIPKAEAEKPPAASATVTEVVPAVSGATAGSGSENKLSLMAKEECWVRVSVLDNNERHEIFSGLIAAGQTQVFPPANKYMVKVGTPSAIQVSLNGKNYVTNHSDDGLPVEFAVPSGDTN